MGIKEQVVESKVEQVAERFNVSADLAFLRLIHSLATSESLHTFDNADIVDGGQDKQIDIFYMEEAETSAEVFIIQGKNTDKFSSNALIQLGNGIDWVFSKKKKDVEKIKNKNLRDKIFEYRKIQTSIGQSNMRIRIIFAANGDSDRLSEEFLQEKDKLEAKYKDVGFDLFEVQIWGAKEIVNEINRIEKRERQIDEKISIIYDVNRPSLIRQNIAGLKGIVCTVSAKEIARVVNSDPMDHVFDGNVRRYLGKRGTVNKDILLTCSDSVSGSQFWFLNNGITIVCEHVDLDANPDDPKVDIKNMQIVNGCQTAKSLSLAQKDGCLNGNVEVLVRIYQTEDEKLVNQIVRTTNNQNKITSKDLKSNDEIQKDLERKFRDYELYYERKPGQYDGKGEVPTNQIVSNETVGQSYLAVCLKRPSDARRRKYKIWGDDYKKVFSGAIAQPYVLSVLIVSAVGQWLDQSGHKDSNDDMERKLANNALFHIARIAAHKFRETDEWGKTSEIEKQIVKLKTNPLALNITIERSFDLLLKLIQKRDEFKSDIVEALKMNQLDNILTEKLHKLRKDQDENRT